MDSKDTRHSQSGSTHDMNFKAALDDLVAVKMVSKNEKHGSILESLDLLRERK